jgi:hypothetical protein
MRKNFGRPIAEASRKEIHRVPAGEMKDSCSGVRSLNRFMLHHPKICL